MKLLLWSNQDSIRKNNDNKINAIKIVNEDDDFGDFRDFYQQKYMSQVMIQRINNLLRVKASQIKKDEMERLKQMFEH